MGEHEPNEQSGANGVNRADGQQMGGASQSAQPQQFQPDDNGIAGQIREHMEVIGADGVHVGTVDCVDGHRIKLTRRDSASGHQEHHHYLSLGLVAGVEGDTVRLSANGDVAYGFEEEQGD